jgi:hypothetical protein
VTFTYTYNQVNQRIGQVARKNDYSAARLM